MLFDVFSPIVQTKTTQNAHENGGFRRFQKWSALKMHRFKNPPFQMLTVKTQAFENGDGKKSSHTVPSISVFKRFCERYGTTHKKGAFSNENAVVWTGENKWQRRFASFSTR